MARRNNEKSQQKAKEEFPDWYYRVMRLLGPDGPEFGCDPEFFDEDISDIEEKPAFQGCECEVDSEVDCDCEDNSDNNTYQGSESGMFYELKELREERKEDLQRKRKIKTSKQTYEAQKEKEVQAVYDSLKAGKEGETGILAQGWGRKNL